MRARHEEVFGRYPTADLLIELPVIQQRLESELGTLKAGIETIDDRTVDGVQAGRIVEWL